MTNDPRDIISPVHIDNIVPGSVTALTAAESPGIVIVKAQAIAPSETSPHTFLLHLKRDDAQQLHAALSACLKGTAN